MSRFDRVFVVDIDSMGIGDGPDAADLGTAERIHWAILPRRWEHF